MFLSDVNFFVYLTDDGTITTALPPDPNDVLDLTEGIEKSVAAAAGAKVPAWGRRLILLSPVGQCRPQDCEHQMVKAPATLRHRLVSAQPRVTEAANGKVAVLAG